MFPIESHREQYQLDLELLWRQVLVGANANYKLALAVRSTPLKQLLGNDSSRWLISRIGENALRLAALDVFNALTDRTQNALTLDFIRQRALALCDPAQRAALEHYLASEFSRRNVALEKRALRLRHKLLAHADVEHWRHPERFLKMRVTREEVGVLLAMAKELVGVLSFDVVRSFDFMPGDDDFDMEECILAVVAKQSRVLRMPEEQPVVFPYVWKGWTEDERSIFQTWRAHLNLSRIDL